MRKILMVILSVLILAVSFAGCGYDPVMDGATTPETTSATEANTQETEKTYENSFDGLETYMNDKGHIKKPKDRVEMKSDKIGAEKGYRYTNGTVNIEMYQYNTEKLSEVAKEKLDSVKKNGYFKIYGEKIDACLTADGKYLMVYQDKEISDDDQAKEAKEKAVTDFENFGK